MTLAWHRHTIARRLHVCSQKGTSVPFQFKGAQRLCRQKAHWRNKLVSQMEVVLPVIPGMCTYTHIRAYVLTHTHMHARTCLHTRMHAHTHTRMHAHTHTHTHNPPNAAGNLRLRRHRRCWRKDEVTTRLLGSLPQQNRHLFRGERNTNQSRVCTYMRPHTTS